MAPTASVKSSFSKDSSSHANQRHENDAVSPPAIMYSKYEKQTRQGFNQPGNITDMKDENNPMKSAPTISDSTII